MVPRVVFEVGKLFFEIVFELRVCCTLLGLIPKAEEYLYVEMLDIRK